MDEEQSPGLRGPDGAPLKVLVVGINYAPEHTGIAPYTSQLSDHLAQRGAEVWVRTGVPHYPSWTVERPYKWRLRTVERRAGLVVERLRHYVPATQSAIQRGLYELTFALNVGLRRLPGRPDVVMAVVPSLLSAAAVTQQARRAKIPAVVWVQDLMGQASAQSGIEGGQRVARLVGSVEARILRAADAVLVLNPHFARHVELAGVAAQRIVIRPNWTHVPNPGGSATEHVRRELGWSPTETVVLHSGNMGLKQALETVVDAARLADARDLAGVRFVLMGDGSQRAALEARADGVRHIDIIDPVGNDIYSDVLAAADILLVNERASSVDMSLPSKLTSYLKAGRPVVSASAPDGGTAAEVVRSGGGVVVAPEDPGALLDAVLALAGDPERCAALGAAGREYAESSLAGGSALQDLERILLRTVSGTDRPDRRDPVIQPA